MTFGMFLPSYRSTVSKRKIWSGARLGTVNLGKGGIDAELMRRRLTSGSLTSFKSSKKMLMFAVWRK